METDLRKIFPRPIDSVKELIKEKIKIISAERLNVMFEEKE